MAPCSLLTEQICKHFPPCLQLEGNPRKESQYLLSVSCGPDSVICLYMHYPIISSQYPTGLSTFIIPNLQMRKLDCRQVEKLTQDHTK